MNNKTTWVSAPKTPRLEERPSPSTNTWWIILGTNLILFTLGYIGMSFIAGFQNDPSLGGGGEAGAATAILLLVVFGLTLMVLLTIIAIIVIWLTRRTEWKEVSLVRPFFFTVVVLGTELYLIWRVVSPLFYPETKQAIDPW